MFTIHTQIALSLVKRLNQRNQTHENLCGRQKNFNFHQILVFFSSFWSRIFLGRQLLMSSKSKSKVPVIWLMMKSLDMSRGRSKEKIEAEGNIDIGRVTKNYYFERNKKKCLRINMTLKFKKRGKKSSRRAEIWSGMGSAVTGSTVWKQQSLTHLVSSVSGGRSIFSFSCVSFVESRHIRNEFRSQHFVI